MGLCSISSKGNRNNLSSFNSIVLNSILVRRWNAKNISLRHIWSEGVEGSTKNFKKENESNLGIVLSIVYVLCLQNSMLWESACSMIMKCNFLQLRGPYQGNLWTVQCIQWYWYAMFSNWEGFIKGIYECSLYCNLLSNGLKLKGCKGWRMKGKDVI